MTLVLAPAGANGGPADIRPPIVTPVIYGTLGANGWYVSNVTVNWAIDGQGYTILETRGCDARTFVADTVGTSLSCYARTDGGETTRTITVKRDATPPTVTAAPARAPDANGWYNHPLTVAFAGTDATSGIASCTHATYSGPDNANASVSGSCSDWAGNQATASAALRYDATAPTISMLEVKPGKHSAELLWRTSPDTQSVELVRSPGLKGGAETVLYQGSAASHRDTGLRAGRKYQYRLTGSDQAGNKATRAIIFLARGSLLNPAPGEHVSAPPLLVWTPVKGATYYNVVLVRARRVYSAWPLRPRLQLPRAWVYRGQRQRLRPGLYRWYVWPGFGRLSAGRYGRLLGANLFVVVSGKRK